MRNDINLHFSWNSGLTASKHSLLALTVKNFVKLPSKYTQGYLKKAFTYLHNNALETLQNLSENSQYLYTETKAKGHPFSSL